MVTAFCRGCMEQISVLVHQWTQYLRAGSFLDGLYQHQQFQSLPLSARLQLLSGLDRAISALSHARSTALLSALPLLCHSTDNGTRLSKHCSCSAAGYSHPSDQLPLFVSVNMVIKGQEAHAIDTLKQISAATK